MNCLIVDDEPLARERLRRLLEDFDGVWVCGEAGDGREALRLVERHGPDLVLLDIRMPGMDGIETARHLCRLVQPPAVVFTTAYGEHALEAFEAQAVDYLLKPVHPERLARALARARRLVPEALDALHGDTPAPRTHLCARVRGGLRLMPVDEVLCLQAEHKYVTARSAADSLLIEDSLKSLEAEFGDRFVRIHRNALVAVDAVRGLEKTADGRTCVVLEGLELRLEVSRRLLPALRRLLRERARAVPC